MIFLLHLLHFIRNSSSSCTRQFFFLPSIFPRRHLRVRVLFSDVIFHTIQLSFDLFLVLHFYQNPINVPLNPFINQRIAKTIDSQNYLTEIFCNIDTEVKIKQL